MLYLKLGLLGVFSYALPFTLFPLGQAHIPSGLTAIINALTPILTVVVAHFWPGGEKAKFNKALGVIAGFAGAALLASPALTGGNAGDQLIGIGFCLLATILYAVTLNVARSFRMVRADNAGNHRADRGGGRLCARRLCRRRHAPCHAPETRAAWLALGLFSTALTFQIMYRLLPRIGATNFASNTFISPVVAIILGVTLLGEIILPVHIAGMLLVFVGLLCIDGRIFKLGRRAPA
ncbi:DMT family transporter [Devosia sp. A8/3-2]|nr:DMT family transporter [Devosia sp. A8/3-2]